MNLPKISVIMPTYNCGDYICEAIDSILSQTYNNFELLIIDDGSTDNTEVLINSYNNTKIKYYRIDPSGKPSIARNVGLTKATGEFILFCDADDLLPSATLQQKINFIQKFPEAALIFTDYLYFRGKEEEKDFEEYSYFQKNNNFIKSFPCNLIAHTHGNFFLFNKNIRQQLLIKLFIHTSTVMVSKTAISTCGLFDETLTFGEDWDLWLRISDEYQIGCIDEILCYARKWNASITTKRSEFLISSITMQRKFLETESLNIKAIQSIRKNIGDKAYEVGYKFFDNYNTRMARHWLWQSIKFKLFSWKQIKYFILACLGDGLVFKLKNINRKIKGS